MTAGAHVRAAIKAAGAIQGTVDQGKCAKTIVSAGGTGDDVVVSGRDRPDRECGECRHALL